MTFFNNDYWSLKRLAEIPQIGIRCTNKRGTHGASKTYTNVSTHPCLITVAGLSSVNIVGIVCTRQKI